MSPRNNRKRTNDTVFLFKLPSSLRIRVRRAARREGVSASKLVRTAIVRLLAELAAGKSADVVWR